MVLALNNQQWLMCHKTKLNQTKSNPLLVVVSKYMFSFYQIQFRWLIK